MERRSIVLLLGLFIHWVFGVDLPKGCEVYDNLIFDPVLYDSVQFHAYVKDSKAVFEAELMCKDRSQTDYLTMTSNHSLIIDNKTRHKISDALESGWHTFDLKVVGNYSIIYDQGQSWPLEDSSPRCEITKISFTKGLFMRHCPEIFPTWLVSSNKGRLLPLTVSEKLNLQEEVIFFSREHFTPVLEVEKKEIKIAWHEGSLKVAQDGPSSPLPPFVHHHLSLSFSRDKENRLELKLLDGLKYLHSLVLKEYPHDFLVKGIHEDKFVVFQRMKKQWSENLLPEAKTVGHHIMQGVTEGIRDTHVSSSDGLVMGLVAALGVCLLTLFIFLIREFRNRMDKKVKTRPEVIIRKPMEESDSADIGGNKGCESMYLHPRGKSFLALPPLPSNLTPRNFHKIPATATLSGPTLPVGRPLSNYPEEEIYEEFDETSFDGGLPLPPDNLLNTFQKVKENVEQDHSGERNIVTSSGED